MRVLIHISVYIDPISYIRIFSSLLLLARIFKKKKKGFTQHFLKLNEEPIEKEQRVARFLVDAKKRELNKGSCLASCIVGGTPFHRSAAEPECEANQKMECRNHYLRF